MLAPKASENVFVYFSIFTVDFVEEWHSILTVEFVEKAIYFCSHNDFSALYQNSSQRDKPLLDQHPGLQTHLSWHTP